MVDVALDKLTRRYEGGERSSAALFELSLTVRSGELLAVVGPSGCGKSTTLRLVAGLDEPDGGTISIGGRSMRGVAPQDRDVAMVFQGYALYPHMKVKDILAFPLKMRGADGASREKAVRDAAELLGLSGKLERRPGELSGGERQRVAMGRAIVRSPKVFLFDEPLSNLDAALRSELRVELGGLVRRLGTTAMYVTHDYVEAMTLGDRIAVMRAGRLEQLGTPREVYERPATSFVAGFLGTPRINLVDVSLDDGALSILGSHLPLGPGLERAKLAGFRPEHVELAPDGAVAPDGGLAIRATIVGVEPLGAESHVALEASGSKLRARVPGIEAPRRGESVTLRVPRGALHWFDARDARIG